MSRSDAVPRSGQRWLPPSARWEQSSGSWLGVRSTRVVKLTAALIVATVLGLSGLMLWFAHEQVQRNFEQDAQQLARMGEEYSSLIFEQTHQVFAAIKTTFANVSSAYALEADFYQLLLYRSEGLRSITQLSLDGTVIGSSDRNLRSQRLRPEVMAALSTGYGEFHLTRWMQGRDLAQTEGEQAQPGKLGFLAFTEQIHDHYFALMLNPDILLNYLETHLNDTLQEAFILRSDGALLVHAHHGEAPPSDSLPLAALQAALINEDLIGGVDSATRVVAGRTVLYRASHDVPLIVAVVVSNQALNQAWWQTATMIFSLTAGALSLTLACAYWMLKAIDRNGESLSAIQQTHLSLQRDHEELQLHLEDLHRQRERLIAARDAARAANDAKSRFIANVSHELRTPLNGVLGAIELMNQPNLTHEQHELLQLQNDAGRLLLSLINDLLDHAKLEAGRIELSVEPFDLTQTVQSVLSPLGVLARKKGLQFQVLWAQDVPRRVVGDALRLQQVLSNLVGNAIKFTDRGEVQVAISRLENPDPELAVVSMAVRDTGIGIAPEKQQHVFEAFTQADASTTRRFGGTGLGLNIAQRLVALQGGSLTVESELERGSRFTLSLPLRLDETATAAAVLAPPVMATHEATTATNTATAIVAEPQVAANDATKVSAPTSNANQAPASNTARPEPANALRSFKVLVAEDNVVNQKLMSSFLKRWQMEVAIATDGEQARTLWRQALDAETPFDLVLMDVQMPQMDGLTATRLIRADELAITTLQRNPLGFSPRVASNTTGRKLHSPRTPILAMTANVSEQDREACLLAGMDGFIAKPIDPKLLMVEMLRLLPDREPSLAS